jgi:hypothetical protein
MEKIYDRVCIESLLSIEDKLTLMNTGDIILFSTNKWYSELIEVGDECVYSHCGVILRDPIYIDASLNGLYLLESGAEPFRDVVDHQYHFGVQIVPLINVINEYVVKREGSMFHRSLTCKRDKDFEQKILEIYKVIKNKPYNCDPFDWLEALFGLHLFDCKITSRFWCSALVGYVYVKLGLINDNVDWSLITPLSWSSSCKNKFIFPSGVSLDKEIKLI